MSFLVDSCRLVGHGTPLFTIAQRAERDLVAGGKLFLGEAEGAADDFYLRHALGQAFDLPSSPGLGEVGWRETNPISDPVFWM